MSALDVFGIDLSGTHLLEASAGTGKTHAITSLYLRLVLEHDLDVREILVVTYTRAATAELRDRIRGRLRASLVALESGRVGDERDPLLVAYLKKRMEGQALARDRERLQRALRGFDEAPISTIHAFAERALREHAFETSAPFDTELVADVTPLVAEIAHDFLLTRLHDADEALVASRDEAPRLSQSALADIAKRVIGTPRLHVMASSPTTGLAADRLALQTALAATMRERLEDRKASLRVRSFDDLVAALREALDAPQGAALRHALRSRYRAALIDEFQDTDPVQYELFRELFAEHGRLLLIGDPKQAIYGFRGADVFAYLAASREEGATRHTLAVNHRSDPSLLRAVEAVITTGKNPFVIEGIRFEPVAAAAGTDRVAPPRPALELLYLSREGARFASNVKDKKTSELLEVSSREEIAARVADDITKLLSSGVTLDGAPIAPEHIAVLCRTNREARLVQSMLTAHGVPTVLDGDDCVFDTDEASDLSFVLAAVLEPKNLRALKSALSTRSLGFTAHDLERLTSDERELDEWIDRLFALRTVWETAGFFRAFRALVAEAKIEQRLLALDDGERRLTNLFHLGELLHAAESALHLGPLALLAHLDTLRSAESREGFDAESMQIRLESDERRTKLLTIHRSKGLEYPVVYCPFLYGGKLLKGSDSSTPRYHTSEGLVLDLLPSDDAKERAKREALAEEARLLYVAMTRARHLLRVVWAPVRSAHASALAHVLSGGDGTRVKNLADERQRALLGEIAKRAEGAIAVRDLPPDTGARFHPARSPAALTTARVATRGLADGHRTASFSSLLASATPELKHALDPESPAAFAGLDRDELAIAKEEPRIALDALPRGAKAGTMLHDVLESIDFENATIADLETAVRTALVRFGMETGDPEGLARALAGVLATPLTSHDGAPFRLRDVPSGRRLIELEFTLPAAGSRITAERIGEALADAQGIGGVYAARAAHLGFPALRGFLRGFVDLIFERGGRFYLVDYKSNHLGPVASDYAPARLEKPMLEHHYVLQYHLYLVALDRYLRARIPGYAYDTHIGGVYYLFLRGMAESHEDGTGIFFDRPSERTIAALSALFSVRR